MDRPSIDNNEVMRQAGWTAGIYLESAIKSINNNLGDGYAAKHPELLAAMVAAQVGDYNNTAMVDAIHELASAVRGHAGTQKETGDDIAQAVVGIGDQVAQIASKSDIGEAMYKIGEEVFSRWKGA